MIKIATGSAVKQDTGRLFEPDTLLSDQFYATLKNNQCTDPERRLMAAILEDAVWCLSKDSQGRSWRFRKSFEEAKSWIEAEAEDDWVFSFNNVCESLGLDPNYLRGGLTRWTNPSRPAAAEPVRIAKYRSGPRCRKLRFRAPI